MSDFYINKARDAIHEAVEAAISANINADNFVRMSASAWEDICRERGKRETDSLMKMVSKI